MTQNADTAQEKFDAILNAIPWRCFHCDFVTSDHAEAEAHFGDRDDAEEFKPICKWWANMPPDEKLLQFQQALKALEAERRAVDRQRVAIEGLEYQVDSIPPDMLAALKELSSMYEHAWDLVDGGLVMLPDSIKRFEAAHAKARAAIAKAEKP